MVLTNREMTQVVDHLVAVAPEYAFYYWHPVSDIVEAVLEALPPAHEKCRHVDGTPFKYEDED